MEELLKKRIKTYNKDRTFMSEEGAMDLLLIGIKDAYMQAIKASKPERLKLSKKFGMEYPDEFARGYNTNSDDWEHNMQEKGLL